MFVRNNLGLPGLDVNTTTKNRYIAVLGSSYTQAYEVAPEKSAVGILQRKYWNSRTKLQVINLGVNGHDLLDLLYRVKYFKKLLNITEIVLIIQSPESEWFKRHKQFYFDINRSPIEKKSKFGNLIIKVRNNSVLLDLFAKSYQIENVENGGTGEKKASVKEGLKYDRDYDEKMKYCLTEYNKLYGGKITLINLWPNPDEAVPQLSKEYILQNKIKYYTIPLNIPENRIEGKGHFNEKGNYELGKFLLQVI